MPETNVFRKIKTLLSSSVCFLLNLGKSGVSPKKSKYLTPLQQKLNELYDAVRNFTDSRGRRLSTIFLRLPSRAELPDYYATIKRPIDMERVRSHMAGGRYQDVEALVEDFALMFNNACMYNEPESLIYRDALVLHRVLLETRKQQEGGEDSGLPLWEPWCASWSGTCLCQWWATRMKKAGVIATPSLRLMPRIQAPLRNRRSILTSSGVTWTAGATEGWIFFKSTCSKCWRRQDDLTGKWVLCEKAQVCQDKIFYGIKHLLIQNYYLY